MDQYKGSDVDKYRCFMSGEGEKNTTWKLGVPPNFDAVNKLFEEGRTKIWPTGSLEEQVQNLVKTWEMELFHKMKPEDFKTVDVTKLSVSINGQKPLTAEGLAKIGGGFKSYLIWRWLHDHGNGDPTNGRIDTAQKLFTTAFPRGFTVEILQVYSGPPVIAYKFRHWGYMEGPFKSHPPTGELVEMFGVATIELDENFKIVKVECFYDKGELLSGLTKGTNATTTGDSIWGGGHLCPFH